jgi:ornithine cyclodeaminase/alanine dehydrogenase-like protein (mu-crystallin family)
VPDLKLLVLSARDVRELLPYGECADLVAGALAALARGEVYQPLRTMISPPAPEGSPAPGLMALMPSIRTGPIHPGPIQPGPVRSGIDAAYSLKAICIFPGNPALGKDAHQGVVLLSSPDTGEPQAVINASALTEIRTAAASVVATRLLARPDVSELSVIGTGVQARAHAVAHRGRAPREGLRLGGRGRGRRRPGGDRDLVGHTRAGARLARRGHAHQRGGRVPAAAPGTRLRHHGRRRRVRRQPGVSAGRIG